MRSINERVALALRPAIVVAVCVLVAVIAVNTITQLARTTPHVGDILVFAPSAVVPVGDDDTRLLVHRQDQFGCVLDLNVLRRSGGSLVIETEIGGNTKNFRVHWAGDRTSGDTGNCGADANLVIDHRDLSILALAAGDYGISHKRIPAFADDISN